MPQRLVLLHGWGATAADLQPLGEQLAAQHPEPLDIVCLEAPEPHPQPGGRQWYGLFPSDWDARWSNGPELRLQPSARWRD
jgi:phospholipase/carboxylesterase